MKASELMIGDLVIAKKVVNHYGKTKTEITKVTDILEDGINAYYAYGELEDYIEEDLIEPILLTEEILAANGWKDSDPNLFNGLHYIFIYGKNHTLTLNHWTNSNTNEEYYTFAIGGGDRVLKYVHELQRVLRCCELFDLANNFKVTADGVTTNESAQNITD